MKKRERHREFGVGARVIVNEKAPGGYVGHQELLVLILPACVRTLISQAPVDPWLSLVSLLLGLACLGCP